jgi:prepilin-type processing-associated H-X9-DG protein
VPSGKAEHVSGGWFVNWLWMDGHTMDIGSWRQRWVLSKSLCYIVVGAVDIVVLLQH